MKQPNIWCLLFGHRYEKKYMDVPFAYAWHYFQCSRCGKKTEWTLWRTAKEMTRFASGKKGKVNE